MTKKNLILGGILIALVAAAYIYQGPMQAWKKKMNQPKNFFSSIDMDNLDKIEIKQDDKSTVLEKNGDKWAVAEQKSFSVKKEIMDEVIQKLKDAEQASLELVSTNKDKKADFRLGAEGITVMLQAKQKQLKLLIGKTGPDYKSTYVAEEGQDRSYLLPLSLETIFSMEDWRDKTIFNTDSAKISKVRFQTAKKQFVIEKNKDKWEGISPKKFGVNQDKMAKILENMSKMEAAAIPEQNFKGTDLDKAKLIIQATGDGIDNTLMVGRSNGKDQYFAKRSDSDNIYLITKDQFNALNQTESSLK